VNVNKCERFDGQSFS